MKTQAIITVCLTLTLISLTQSMQIATKKHLNFDIPQSMYAGYVSNQVVQIPLDKYLPSTAVQVCLVFYTTMGGAPGGAFWVKLETDYDFHYTLGVGRDQNVWIENSEEFCLYIGPSRNLTLSVQGKIGGLNHGISVSYAGYFWSKQLYILNQIQFNSI